MENSSSTKARLNIFELHQNSSFACGSGQRRRYFEHYLSSMNEMLELGECGNCWCASWCAAFQQFQIWCMINFVSLFFSNNIFCSAFIQKTVHKRAQRRIAKPMGSKYYSIIPYFAIPQHLRSHLCALHLAWRHPQYKTPKLDTNLPACITICWSGLPGGWPPTSAPAKASVSPGPRPAPLVATSATPSSNSSQ